MKNRQFLHDPFTAVLGAILSLFGLLFAFDAGYARSLRDNHGFIPPEFKLQLGMLPFALLAFFGVRWLGRSRLLRLAKVAWLGAIVLLIMVLVPPFKFGMNGADRWIKIGFIRLQPAEFVKVALILYLSAVFSTRKSWPKRISKSKDAFQHLDRVVWPKVKRFLPGLWVAIALLLIDKEPDMGTALVVAVTALAIIFAGGASGRSLLIGSILAIGCLAIMVKSQPYRVERLLNHTRRWEPDFIDGSGYQTVQSEFSMASGGLFGVGIGNGHAAHVMPAATTDFVMATVAEEFGLVGVAMTFLLLGTVSVRLILAARRSKDKFSSLALSGVGVWLAFQAVLNLCQANGTLPPIGVPFPFVSSGGSSLVALWAALGLCEALQAPILTQAVVEVEVPDANSSNRRRDRRSRLSRA